MELEGRRVRIGGFSNRKAKAWTFAEAAFWLPTKTTTDEIARLALDMGERNELPNSFRTHSVHASIRERRPIRDDTTNNTTAPTIDPMIPDDCSGVPPEIR